jgi:hypothetical protein
MEVVNSNLNFLTVSLVMVLHADYREIQRWRWSWTVSFRF